MNAAACALTQYADGIPSSDPYYGQIRAMQEKGAGYKEELALLRSTGEFNDMDGLDHLNDFLTKNDEARQRISRGVKLVLGTLGTVAGGTVAVSGGAGCAPTAGASCALVPSGL